MPQKSYPYAGGYMFALSQRLLGSARLARLVKADYDEAAGLLREMGYGSAAEKAADVDGMIDAELKAARKAVFEVTPEPETVKLFLQDADAHNLKVLLKARLLGVKADDMLLPDGFISTELMRRAVDENAPELLEEPFSGAVSRSLKLLESDPDPRLISAEVDRAVFAHIAAALQKSKNGFVKRYFAAKADAVNIRSLIRAKALGWGAAELEPMLVTMGEISPQAIAEALELPAEQWAKKLGGGNPEGWVSRCLAEYAATGDAASVDAKTDALLMEAVRHENMDVFGMGPTIGYLLGREAEACALRVIFAAKRAGRTPVLPEQYV